MSSLGDPLHTFRVSSSVQSQGSGAAPPGTASPSQETSADQEIDLQALARKVYALLKQELKRERDRLGWNRPR
jgi:hypothetical protein